MATLALEARVETWPIAGEFTISRGSKREAVVVVAELSDGRCTGRGECVPYPRYGETPEAALAQIRAAADGFGADPLVERERLPHSMPAGAARNALDCALWDLAAKRAGQRAHELAGLPCDLGQVWKDR